MRQVIAIILIASVLLQSMNKLVVEVSYELNKDYIAKNLCVNRDKPMMHCNGKCHLAKQLQKTENDNNKNKTAQRLGFDFYVTAIPIQYKPQPIYVGLADKAFTGYSTEYSFDPLDHIFRPPGIA